MIISLLILMNKKLIKKILENSFLFILPQL